MNNTPEITALLASPQPVHIITPPDEIHVTFTEDDQRTAGMYHDRGGCLLCCALKRMGYQTVRAGGTEVKIDRAWWDFSTPSESEANPIHFYHGHSLVGKTLVLRKRP